MIYLRNQIILLLICFFKWSYCDISSILFPFNTAIDQNLENKNQERNLTLRNRFQPNYSNQDYKNQYTNTNLLNKLTFDKQHSNRNPNAIEKSIVPDLFCEKEEWMCHDKLRCIPKSQVCNKIQNCIDSSDELACENKCRGDEFKCNNNKCIPERFICDEYADCPDGSDELGCDGTGKISGILKFPKLTGNLKLDLDSFESIENLNLNMPTMTRESNSESKSKTDNHPNKHPDIFHQQNHNLNKNDNDQNNQINDNNHVNSINNQKIEPTQPSTTSPPTSTTTKASTTTTAKTIKTNNPTKQNMLTNKSTSKDQDRPSIKKVNDSLTKIQMSTTTPSSYEAPYVKIFPLTPVVKNTVPVSKTPNGVAFNNYAILTNKLINSSNTDSSNKSLIENLGFNVLNKSIESPKQEVATTSKVVKLGQNKIQEINKNLVNARNGIQASLGDKKEAKSSQVANRSSIDLSKSNPGGNRLAFSLTLPKATEPTATVAKQEGNNRKLKNKDDSKKLSCKKNPTIPACQHCSYGLFRCSMGKCVITSFECGNNATQTTTRGRRVSVNVNDFLQFV